MGNAIGTKKKDYRQFLSGLSFIFAGNIFEAHRSFFGWWNLPEGFFILLGYWLMDEYAKRYDR